MPLRKEVEALHQLLERKGIAVGKYHGGLSDSLREEQQDAFLNDSISIMVATNAFGMGINKSNVRYVITINCRRIWKAIIRKQDGQDVMESTVNVYSYSLLRIFRLSDTSSSRIFHPTCR